MTHRVLLFCGILSPLLYAAADMVAGMSWAGYSFRDQTISELGAIGAPSRALFTTLLIPVYVLLVAFGAGVWRVAAGERRLRVAAALLIAFGIIALTVGQFAPMRLRGMVQGSAGALHLAEGLVEMLILVAAMGFAAALGGHFRRYTFLTIIVMLAFGLWSGLAISRVEAGLPTPWIGVKERIFWYAYQLWFIVLAASLLAGRDRRADRASPG